MGGNEEIDRMNKKFEREAETKEFKAIKKMIAENLGLSIEKDNKILFGEEGNRIKHIEFEKWDRDLLIELINCFKIRNPKTFIDLYMDYEECLRGN